MDAIVDCFASFRHLSLATTSAHIILFKSNLQTIRKVIALVHKHKEQ